ncbi:phosphatase PAP2 family protein [Streptomyces beijiangensis]|uniref:Phosphatase PAP2 family protein n=1 Tax=Streptomyces beijiangensis TaxID=163361 RepID=A0A939JE68_9ACTN|nr:phosphatase PAP2 family protein [Streptomyces beijiangensis]MBO0511008.1 phosphatase PAP2 family protein [Streptomyces beijiangensis]
MHSALLSPPAHQPPTAPLRTGSVCAALTALLLILVAAEWSPLMRFDRWLAEHLHRSAVAEPGFTHLNRVLTDWVWDPWALRALLGVAVLWLFLRKDWRPALWVGVTGAVGTLLQQGMKAAVGRARPQWPDPVDSAHYASFPSGHAMTATVSIGLLLWLLRRSRPSAPVWRTAVAAAAVSVVGVGLTRLYLGVHWASDVLGGWLLGAALVAFSVSAYGRLRS